MAVEGQTFGLKDHTRVQGGEVTFSKFRRFEIKGRWLMGGDRWTEISVSSTEENTIAGITLSDSS